MPTNILKRPYKKAQLGRNGYDLSRDRAFTSPVGMLLPVFTNFAYSGEKVRANSSTFIRTEAVNTAAFIKLRHHVDWFFVPIFNLYQFWNEFYNMTDDVHTSFVLDDKRNGYSLPFLYLDRFYGATSSNNFYGFLVTEQQKNYFLFKVDEFGVPFYHNARRLSDMFGYGALGYVSYGEDGAEFYSVNPFKYLAYHAVWYSHYNNSQYFKNIPSMYNCDRFHGNDYSLDEASLSLNDKIISTIHYRPFKRDIFTNIQPAPSFNSSWINYLGFSNTSLYSSTLKGSISPEAAGEFEEFPNLGNSEGNFPYISSFLEIKGNGSSGLSISDIRSLYALDKLFRVTGSTGSHYDQQTLAHLGFKVPTGISKEPYFLGSQSFDIVINEVVATATTASESDTSRVPGKVIGDIAGKGFGSTGKEEDIEFTAPCEGIFIALSSIEPLCDYASMGIETENLYATPYDFWRPELDNVGMAPAFNCFFNVGVDRINPNSVLGWTYRWSELKESFNVVNEGFWRTSKRSWVSFKQDNYNAISDPSYTPSLYNLFFISPQYTNPIFAASFDRFKQVTSSSSHSTAGIYQVPVASLGSELWFDTPASDCYEADNFLINMHIKFYKTSPMSVHSLPRI